MKFLLTSPGHEPDHYQLLWLALTLEKAGVTAREFDKIARLEIGATFEARDKAFKVRRVK